MHFLGSLWVIDMNLKLCTVWVGNEYAVSLLEIILAIIFEQVMQYMFIRSVSSTMGQTLF